MSCAQHLRIGKCMKPEFYCMDADPSVPSCVIELISLGLIFGLFRFSLTVFTQKIYFAILLLLLFKGVQYHVLITVYCC